MNKLFRLLFLFTLFFMCLSVSAKKEPAIKFDTELIDLGTLTDSNSKKTVEFTFRNTGKGKLVILNIDTGCGCTQAEFPKDFIKPGATGKIRVTFDAKKSHAGDFVQTIRVTTNIKSHPMAFLRIQGKSSITPPRRR